MARGLQIAMVIVLVVSALVTALTSGIISPGAAPDEAHHFAYVKYVADHPLEFPPKHHKKFTGDGIQNHLMHPPLYYQLMAVPYRMLQVDRHLTSVGRAQDEYGRISSRVAILPLRSASFLLALTHLVGLYVLCRYLVRIDLLPGWAALVAVACLALVPGYIFIAGTLNNDVLAMAVWPFLALTTIKFVRKGRRRDGYLTVALIAVTLMTKATLWPMALVAASAVVGRLAVDISRQSSSPVEVAARVRERLMPRSTGQWVLLAVTSALVGATLVNLGVNYVRYGDFHPAYRVVYDLTPEESKFYRASPDAVARRSVPEFAMWATTLTFRSLFGVLGHIDRIYSPNPDRLAEVVVALALLGVVLGVWRLWPREEGRREFADWLAVALMATAFLFMATLLYRQYGAYHRMGRFGAQGRYLIGYVDLWLIGLLIAVSQTWRSARRMWSRVYGGILSAAVSIALLWLMVDPLLFPSQTSELRRGMNVYELVQTYADDQDMNEVTLQAISPRNFVNRGVRDSDEFGKWFRMAWSGSTVAGEVDVKDEDCIEVLIYGRGDEAWGDASQLEVAVIESVARGWSGTMVELPPRPEVVSVVLERDGLTDDTLVIRQNDITVVGPRFLGSFWPRIRVVDLFSANARGVDCS